MCEEGGVMNHATHGVGWGEHDYPSPPLRPGNNLEAGIAASFTSYRPPDLWTSRRVIIVSSTRARATTATACRYKYTNAPSRKGHSACVVRFLRRLM